VVWPGKVWLGKVWFGRVWQVWRKGVIFMVYKWKNNYAVSGVKASDVGFLFEKLEKENDGLYPKDIVEVSRPKDAILHNAFEWDNSVAADKYRENQAANIIRSVAISINDEKDEEIITRAFVNVVHDEKRSYTNIQTVISDKDLKMQLLADAKKELTMFRIKYSKLNELENIFKEIERVI
jgi:hypothetical protein